MDQWTSEWTNEWISEWTKWTNGPMRLKMRCMMCAECRPPPHLGGVGYDGDDDPDDDPGQNQQTSGDFVQTEVVNALVFIRERHVVVALRVQRHETADDDEQREYPVGLVIIRHDGGHEAQRRGYLVPGRAAPIPSLVFIRSA